MNRALFGPLVFWFLGLAFTEVTALALEPEKAITQYSRAIWRTEEGLPQNTVRAMAQTSDGYLWFGTQAGLVRFDGVLFKVYNRRNSPVFENHHVYALAVDRSDTLWVGTNGGGLIRLQDEELRRYGVDDGLPTGRVTALEIGLDGDLWIGTYGGGLVHFDGEKMDIFNTSDGLAHDVIFALDSDGAGGVWIGTYGGGVSHFRDGQFDLHLNTSNGLRDNGVFAIHQAADGDLWIGTNQGLHRYHDGVVEVFTVAEGLSHDRILSIVVDRDGILWVGTYGGGLNRRVDGEFTYLNRIENGFTSDNVWSLFEDLEGAIWAGTLGGGLVQLKDGPFTTYSVAEGLASELPSSFYEDRQGALWIGSRNRGLSRFQNGKFETFTTAQGLASNNIWTVVGDHRGDVWVGTTGSGLGRLQDGRWTNFTTRDGLAGNAVFALAVDQHHDLWIGTNKGLNRYREGRFELFTSADGLANNQVRTFEEDRDGNLWIGTSGGVSRFDGETFTTFTTAQGLSSNNVWTVQEDRAGVIWMGTYGGGLNRFKDGQITTVTTREGLFDDDLTAILEDDQGFLWIGTSRGIFRVVLDDLNAFLDGRAPDFSFVTYSRGDGLKSADCYGGDPPGWRGRDGRLWFATLDGIAVVDPSLVGIRSAPAVLIEKVEVDGRRLLPDPDPLPPTGLSYDFHFAAPTLAVPDKVHLRYRLKGLDETWREAGSKERSVVFNSLRPGNYTFEVMASDEVGRWTGEPVEYSFVINPAFHQTPAFFGLCALAVGLVGYGFHRVRVQHLKRREKELAVRVAEALADLKVLRGLLPICSSCRMVRDDEGYWKEIETFIHEHSEASFSHGVCPGCAKKLYPEYFTEGDEELV